MSCLAPIHRHLPICLMALAFLGPMPARAGLFEDEEARKAILDLRARVEQNAQAASTGQDDLRNEVTQLRRSLLQLNTQLETVRSEVAQLRGTNEQLAREIAELQRRQKDLLASYDERLRAFEPVKVSLDGMEFSVDPAEKRMYEAAIAQFRQGQFPQSQVAFADFLRRHPQSGYAPWALLWLANSQYAQKAYKDALGHFQTITRQHAEHPKAPEAMLSAANCQIELKDLRGARKTLEDLRARYSQSEAAQAATERLKRLR